MKGSRVNFADQDTSIKIRSGGTGTTVVFPQNENELDFSMSHKGQNRLLGNNRTSVDYNYRFKVILLGDSKVGKSSIVRRLDEDTFNLNYQETSFFDTINKRIIVNMDEVVLL
jgi:hypothetical protein